MYKIPLPNSTRHLYVPLYPATCHMNIMVVTLRHPSKGGPAKCDYRILYVSPYWKPFWIFVCAARGTREWSPALNPQIDPEMTWPRMVPFLARRWPWNDPQGIPRTGSLNRLNRNRNTNIFSIKRVNRKIKEVWRFSRAKHRQGNVQKSLLNVQSCFLLIREKVCCTWKVVLC